MKEKLLKSIVLLMVSVIVFSSTTLMFSAEEAPDNTTATTTTTTATTTAAETTTGSEKTTGSETTTGSEKTTGSETTTVAETTTKPREHGSAIDEEDSDYDIVTFDDRSFANQKTTKAPTKAPAKKTTKAPAKKTTKRAPINALETTVEETSSDIYIDELLAETTAYAWTFAEEETEPEDNAKKSIDFKKIVIIAVIVLAVIGAGVCLIILGKKR